MKLRIIPILLMLAVGLCILPEKTAAQVSVNFQVFYDDLSPYGYWVDNPEYGYVWVPNVDRGFTPYATNGHWIYTEDGWTWVSNYSWGWAPFHYGRWFYESGYGWLWVPDNEWGPGWVTWRRSDDYYGWAPIGPGITIDLAYSNSYNMPYNNWTFVRNRDFGRTNINNYYINNSNNVTIINNTTVINNIHVDRARNVRYNTGPERTEVEKHVGRSFTPVAIKESIKPGQRLNNNQLEIYRPQVQKNNDRGPKPIPARVEKLNDVKNPTRMSSDNQTRKQDQPVRIQPIQQQPDRPVEKRPGQIQRTSPPIKEQPVQQQRNNPPVRQQPVQQQKQNQPIPQPRQKQPEQRPAQQQRNNPPVKQQPAQQQRQNQPTQQPRQKQPEQQPAQQQRNNPPVRQQQAQQQRPDQPVKQKPVQPQKKRDDKTPDQ